MLSMAVPLAAVTFVPGHTALATVQAPQNEKHPAVGPPTDGVSSVTTKGGMAGPAAASAAPNAAGAQLAPAPVTIAAGQGQEAQTSRQSDDGDDADNMRVLGISSDYRRGLAEAGFPNLSSDDLAEARAGGVSPQYARDMRATGMRLSLDDVIEARNMGLSAAYIAAMRSFGIKGGLDDYQSMRSVGVTADFVRHLRSRGIKTTDPDELTSLRASGSTSDP
jgi:hypothetical protein